MRFISLATIISVASYFQTPSALPFNKRAPPPSYSIVNVDGSNGANAAATVTLIRTHTTTLAAVTETVLATITVNAIVTVPETKLSTISTPSSSALPVGPNPTPADEPSAVTSTVTERPEPTSYYDDGFWHTRYAITDTSISLISEGTASPATSASASASISPDLPVVPSGAPFFTNTTHIQDTGNENWHSAEHAS